MEGVNVRRKQRRRILEHPVVLKCLPLERVHSPSSVPLSGTRT